MKTLKAILLFPFWFIWQVIKAPLLPIRLAWKWSEGASFKTGNAWGGGGSEIGGCLPRLVGTIFIAGLIYYGIGWCVLKVVNTIKGNAGEKPAAVEQQNIKSTPPAVDSNTSANPAQTEAK